MGTEEIWVPLALAALSTGAGVYNQRLTSRKQDAALAAQIRNQGAKQKEADVKVGQLIGQEKALTPKPQQAAEEQAMAAVRSANAPSATAALNVPGAVSKAYEGAKGNAALGISDYGNTMGDLMARTDAPRQARLDFAKNLGDYSTGIGQISRAARGQQFLDQMRLNAIRANPWLTATQQIAGAAASSYGGGGGWGSMLGGGTGGAAANDFSGAMPGEWSGNPVDPWSMSGLDKANYSYMRPAVPQY